MRVTRLRLVFGLLAVSVRWADATLAAVRVHGRPARLPDCQTYPDSGLYSHSALNFLHLHTELGYITVEIPFLRQCLLNISKTICRKGTVPPSYAPHLR